MKFNNCYLTTLLHYSTIQKSDFLEIGEYNQFHFKTFIFYSSTQLAEPLSKHTGKNHEINTYPCSSSEDLHFKNCK